jgi:hypothetical protein
MSLRGKRFLCAVGIAAVVLAACRRSESAGASPAGTTPSPSQASLHPPFGYIDTPKENDTVAAGTWSYGWALDDSGVASVDVSLDNGPTSAAAIGQPFPGVKEAYPNYPEADKAGFGFPMPSAATGPHLLTVTITARDGGKTDLKRHVQVK